MGERASNVCYWVGAAMLAVLMLAPLATSAEPHINMGPAMQVHRPVEPRPADCEVAATIVTCEQRVQWCVTPDGAMHKILEEPSSFRDKRRLCRSA